MQNEEQDRPDQQLTHAIVNAFIGDLAFQHPAVEKLLKESIRDEEQWTQVMLQNINDVFSPIFFHYPNALHDKTVWSERDACAYIK